jgi:hypothetical protein
MQTPIEVEGVFPALLTINRQAFALAQYEVAYHALAAALHSACDDANRDHLREVQTIALRQGEWIDSHSPEDRISSTSARLRGHDSMYSMLERQAGAAIHIDYTGRSRRNQR